MTNRIYAIEGTKEINATAIPAELKQLKQWVAWRGISEVEGKKPRKMPMSPYGGAAKSNDPSTWGNFDEAWTTAEHNGYAGIGFEFSLDDPYAGVDIDHCIDPATGDFTSDTARELVKKYGSYCEISPSGTGVKLIIQSSIKVSKAGFDVYRSSTPDEKISIETYAHGRFFAVTGKTLPGMTEIIDCTQFHEDILRRFTNWEPKVTTTTTQIIPIVPIILDDVHLAWETGKIRAALKTINSEQEGQWHSVLCSIKHWGAVHGRDDIAKALFEEWSSTTPEKYDQGELDSRWARVTPDGGLTAGSIYHEATINGWDNTAVDADGTPLEDPSAVIKDWGSETDRDGQGQKSIPPGSDAFKPKPVVMLPGGAVRISDSAAALGKLMASTGEVYQHGGASVVLCKTSDGTCRLDQLSPRGATSRFEEVASLCRWEKSKKGIEAKPAICSTEDAGRILESRQWTGVVPEIKVMTDCPVIVRMRDGSAQEVHGYDAESCVYAGGRQTERIQLSEGVELIKDMLFDFEFATPNDRSRAIASIISPALVFGGWLEGGHAPVDLTEADQSQSGKGYRCKLTTAIYNAVPASVNVKSGGVGSMEESFDTKVIEGRPFILLDNVRAKVVSDKIETYTTMDSYGARVPHRMEVNVDPRRTVLMMTTNKAEMSIDLSKRCSIVNIMHRPAGYDYRAFPEGDILARIRAHQPRYLGAVHAIVREWASRGCLKASRRYGDSFAVWWGIMEWILVNIMGEASCIDGQNAARTRVTSPMIQFLREIGIMVEGEGLTGTRIRASRMVDIANDNGLEIPGCDADLSMDEGQNTAAKWIGRRLKPLFDPLGDGEGLDLGGFIVIREKAIGEHHRETSSYIFKLATTEIPNNRLTPPDVRLKSRVKNPNNRLKPPENTEISLSSDIDDIKVLDRDGEHQAVQADPNVFQAVLSPSFQAGSSSPMPDDCWDDDFLAPKGKSGESPKSPPSGTTPPSLSSPSSLSLPYDPDDPTAPENDVFDERYISKPSYMILKPVATTDGSPIKRAKSLF